jgi:FkbM family methyltransferase
MEININKKNYCKKLLNYFLFIPLNRFFFNLTIKLNKNFYKFFFNFYSFLFGEKVKILYQNNFFYIKTHNAKWRFFHKNQGLMAYSNGLLQRSIKLKKEYLIENINFNDNDCIIDCGANNGDFFLCFKENIKYTGIEPSKIEYSNLSYNIKNQNLINKAAWKNSNSFLDFYISGEFGDNSLIKIKSYTEIYKVKTITLDEIIDKISNNIKLIKIEAEGAEPEVLEGLSKHLGKVQYITIDCGFERGFRKESTLTQCTNYLLGNNFELVDFSDIRVVCLFQNKSINKNSH